MSSCGGQEASGNSNKLCLKSCVVSLQDTDSDENSDEAPGPWPLRQMDSIFNGSSRRIHSFHIFQNQTGRDLIKLVAYKIIFNPFLLSMHMYTQHMHLRACPIILYTRHLEARLEAPSICSSQDCKALRFGADLPVVP